MKRLYYIFAGFILLAGCVTEAPEMMTEKQYCTVKAGFSGNSTRVSLTQDPDSRDMIARWQRGDKIKTYMLTNRKTVENPSSFLYDISEDGKSGVFTFELDEDIRLEREGYRLFALTFDDDNLDEPRELKETPYIDCSLKRVPMEEFRAPVLYDGMVNGSDYYCNFRHFYTYELLHVKNSSSSDISFSLLGFEATLVWYKIFASFDMTPDGLQEGSPSTARCHPVETSSEITIPAGATGVIVSAYIPNGQSIQDATLVASINGAVVRTVDTKTSGAVLQPGRAYHMYVTWDGKELCFGNFEPNPEPEAVDLGLPSGVKWASFNLGASAPEDYGDYFAWAETEPMETYDGTWSSWIYYGNNGFEKYNSFSDYGRVDYRLALEMTDDAAAVILGGDWRIPTYEDYYELVTTCSYETVEINGVKGLEFKASNGNSIFLPFGGKVDGETLSYAGTYGYYWTSCAYYFNYGRAYEFRLGQDEIKIFLQYYPIGISVRPVQSAFVDLTGIRLSEQSIELFTSETATLEVGFTPSNSTHGSICYVDSSDEAVIEATISDTTVSLTAIAPGTATITVWSENGLSASCFVTVKEIPAAEAVDLGLSVLWATCNVGASSPEEQGLFYAWGETTSKTDYDWTTYKWCNGSPSKLTKYCQDSGYGSVDYNSILLPEDDAACTLGDGWRSPTFDELYELMNTDNCDWVWTTVNGVEGFKVISKKKGYQGNYIFLPSLPDEGSYQYDNDSYYWSSELSYLSSDHSYKAVSLVLKPNQGPSLVMWLRCDGCAIRPVRPADRVELTGIALDCTTLTLNKGESHQLSVGYTPQNAYYSGVEWSSSNSDVASVDQDGVVTAQSSGFATITATSKDNTSLSTSCEVNVITDQAPAVAVNLGLSVRWASCNVGATKPEEYGDFFAWGETEAYYEPGYSLSSAPVWKPGKEAGYDWPSYKWCNDGAYNKLTKYCPVLESQYWDGPGSPDKKTVLDSEDDAASANWGSGWRMPTYDEWMELKNNCTWAWTDNYNGTGVAGRVGTASNGNSIFLPATGRFVADQITEGWGWYWSSSLNTDAPYAAYYVTVDEYGSSLGWGNGYYRPYGFSVRPVYSAD